MDAPEHPASDADLAFRALARSAPLGTFRTDPVGLCLYVNDEWSRITGLTPDEAHGEGWARSLHPEDRDRVAQEWARAAREGRPFRSEYRFRRPDGTVAWAIGQADAERDGRGRIVGYLGTVLDVTDWKRAEDERHRLELRLAADVHEIDRLHVLALGAGEARPFLREALEAAMLVTDADRGSVQLHDPGAKVLRLVAQIGFTPDFVERFAVVADGEAACGAAMRRGCRVIVEDVWTDPEFTGLRPLADAAGFRAVQSTPLISRRGELLGMLSTHFREPRRPSDRQLRMLDLYCRAAADILDHGRGEAERERLLAAERGARERAQALARIARELVQSLDPTVVAERIPEIVCEILGGSLAVLYALDPANGDLIAIASAGPRAVRLGGSYRFVRGTGLVGLAVREGRSVVTADLLDDPRIRHTPDEQARIRRAGHRAACAMPLVVHGEVIGALGVGDGLGRVFDDEAVRMAEGFADLAALALSNARQFAAAESQRAAAQADSRAKDEFLAMLGHEIRNPLGAIATAIAVLDRRPDAARPREIIRRQTRHLARLVDDLLDVTRLQSGKIALRREPVDLAQVATRCVAAVTEGGAGRGHDLQLVAVPTYVDGDATRLEQVIANLLDNALKYTPPGGRIRVRIAPEDGVALLSVQDTGIGIAPDLLPRIFDSFVQDDRSLERARGGLGLGLTLVRRLVELHGGAVAASSAGRDHGSEFVVRLPLSPRTPPPRPADGRGGNPATVAAPLRILVIEDNSDVQESLRLLLESAGHRVETADDGPRGLASLVSAPPDVALVDLGLPGLDGFALARAAAPAAPSVRLIAISGYGQPDDRRRSAEAGFHHHLVKPIDPAELARVLDARGLAP